MLESPQALSRGLHCRKRQHQDRVGATVLPAAIVGELRAFPQGFQHISGKLCHGAVLLRGRRPEQISQRAQQLGALERFGECPSGAEREGGVGVHAVAGIE